MRELSIDNFKRVERVTYKDDQYLVRDNGAIYRLRRPNQKKRPLDEVWTRGSQCFFSGYMKLSEAVVHRIVATAFLGEQPSPDHVVDHIDTNRRNNRVENLRWITRLENILDNPKTLRRVEYKWGSIEGLLKDPDRAEKVEPLSNRSWMRQRPMPPVLVPDTQSLTPLAVQRSWRTPCEFPCCPEEPSEFPLKSYFERIQDGSIFTRNRFGESHAQLAGLKENGLSLYVITNISNGVKGWGLTQIIYEDGKFVHIAEGTFFTFEGARKRYCGLMGQVWDGEDSIDDYC